MREESSPALLARLDLCADRGDSLVSASLLETELGRMAARPDADLMVSYDHRRSHAARAVGLAVLSPC